MRKPEYLSPSNIRLYFEDPEQWYIRYLSDYKVPKWPQTYPMSVGSAFDAFVKSCLHSAIFGSNSDPRFSLETLFEAQVESINRDWAWKQGEQAFKIYKSLGALSDLMLELQQAVGQPRFEIEIQGIVRGEKEGIQTKVGGVILLGKPDVYFRNKAGYTVILDWKVNGWCSNYPTSPAKGYIRLRGDSKKSGHHKDAIPMEYQGMLINAAHYLEDVNQDWADQLCTYGWLCGEEIGVECITAIDQLACRPALGGFPDIRVAEHRTRVSSDYQWGVYQNYCFVADVIESNHVFKDVPFEQSMERCLMLDEKAKMLLKLHESGTPEDEAFKQLTGMI